jgi:hypothetical protein
LIGRDAWKQKALALQERILRLEPALPEEPRALVADMRSTLRMASDEGVLATEPGEIFKLLKNSESSDGKVLIVGGYKDFKRTGKHPRFLRTDGAWFHFTLTVERRKKKPLDLLAYDFELCLPEGTPPAFVRFDLNPRDHHNEEEGLRSHFHPGSDDFSVPAPFLSPLELLGVLLYGVPIPKDPRAISA